MVLSDIGSYIVYMANIGDVHFKSIDQYQTEILNHSLCSLCCLFPLHLPLFLT